MKPELQVELFRRYPKLFRKPGKRLVHPEVISELGPRLEDDNGPFGERGIECGDGWFALVDRLCGACEHEIETLISQDVPKECWPRVAQIKGKMGGLRFYVNESLTDELRALILTVEEEESRRTCEYCGAPGKLREGEWRHTYCDQHAELGVTICCCSD